tara:strand:- start:1034 stop:2200 length:1167 start_codon:yes stop_codon:yes gene_type:complete
MSINKEIAVVGGAGHIGLPFSCLLQNNGLSVTIIDTNKAALEKISNNEAPFLEEGLVENMKRAIDSGLNLSLDIKDVANKEFVIITLGTSSKKDDIENFNNIISSIIKNVSEGTKIILRSTVAVNTCNEINKNKLFDEKKLQLAYCPERIAEGKSFKEILSLPQIVGTKNGEHYEDFNELFSLLSIEIMNTNFNNAEFVKLFSNTYRFIEFSLVNEFYNIALDNEINFEEIFHLATHNYPRLKHLPREGLVGGPCLPKDTETFLNSYRPKNKVISSIQKSHDQFIANVLKNCIKFFTDKTVIQFGITFKPDSDDTRESQSLIINKLLEQEGFKVYVVDPYVEKKEVGIEIYKYEEIENLSNNIIITTNHSPFESYNLDNKKVYKVGYK